MKKTLGLLVVLVLIAGILVYYPTEKRIVLAPSPTEGFIVDTNYRYDAFGPGKEIPGTKYTIPSSMATGTNLATDTYISVENIPLSNSIICSADNFLPLGSTKSILVTENGILYSVASSSGAGAGNRYEETVYALVKSNSSVTSADPCKAIRYFIHYGAIENYPEGVVKEFDKQALISKFDQIRRVLVSK